MSDHLNDIEVLTWMERRFGLLTKSIPNFSMDKVDRVKVELVGLLQKYKSELNIRSPLPFIRMWTEENKVNFLFFDKNTGKRILLGEWLEGKDAPYEQ